MSNAMHCSSLVRSMAALFVLLTPVCVAAQELETTIESEGEAIVEVEPAFISFRLVRTAEGATVAAATVTALAFEAALKEALTSETLIAESIVVSGVRVVSVETKTVETTAQIRFALASVTADDRAKTIATFCDDVSGLIALLQCTLEGPFLEPEGREAFEQDAITRATENALYKADAAAAAMQSTIELVRAATIVETSWETEGVNGAVPADSLRLLCHARVKMVYKLQY